MVLFALMTIGTALLFLSVIQAEYPLTIAILLFWNIAIDFGWESKQFVSDGRFSYGACCCYLLHLFFMTSLLFSFVHSRVLSLFISYNNIYFTRYVIYFHVIESELTAYPLLPLKNSSSHLLLFWFLFSCWKSWATLVFCYSLCSKVCIDVGLIGKEIGSRRFLLFTFTSIHSGSSIMECLGSSYFDSSWSGGVECALSLVVPENSANYWNRSSLRHFVVHMPQFLILCFLLRKNGWGEAGDGDWSAWYNKPRIILSALVTPKSPAMASQTTTSPNLFQRIWIYAQYL